MTQTSVQFERLHPSLRQWVWRQGWRQLNPIQEAAIPALMDGESDVIITAATAAGKTEAAFLPALSRMLARRENSADGALATVLYLSPLKALINDQCGRLEAMAEGLDIPVTPWHGDVGQHVKRRFADRPSGVLLITPESLEAMFVNRGPSVRGLFACLDRIIIDELHAFMGLERGRQLQSLMHRLEVALRRRVPRVGLSATLGDMGVVAEFLRPFGGERVTVIRDARTEAGLRLQVRGYLRRNDGVEQGADDAEADEAGEHERSIAGHLFATLRGSNNLVFANARAQVERYADLLARECERLGVPNEFWPHHGSLSRTTREMTEQALKGGDRPSTAVCTSTLEMGVDIGSVKSVAQIGPPFSVAALRQRLGRSGRRGEASILRVYVTEPELGEDSAPQDRLRMALFQSCAIIEKLLERWVETPGAQALHLSTLVQQVLSVIAERGGASAQSLWNVLCERAPFHSIGRETFVALLRQMGRTELLAQSPDGTLLHGKKGERLVSHYDFYAAFATPDEYTLLHRGRVVGKLPTERPLAEGMFLIFAGRRWRIERVEAERREVLLAHARGGQVPQFSGAPGLVDDEIRQAMLELYERETVPRYLDAQARRLFEQGRAYFRDAGIATMPLIADGAGVLAFPWCGDVALHTLALLLSMQGVSADFNAGVLSVEASLEDTGHALQAVLSRPAPAPLALAARVGNKEREKYDGWLGDGLLDVEFAARQIDIPRALEAARVLRDAWEMGVEGQTNAGAHRCAPVREEQAPAPSQCGGRKQPHVA